MVSVMKTGYKQTEIGVIPEDWEARNFGDVTTSCSSGATPYRGRPEYYKGNVKWITSGELNYNLITDTIEHISDEAVKNTNLRIHPVGTFLIAITVLEAAGTRGSCGIVGSPSTTNQSCMAIYPTSELLTSYLYHYYVYRGNELAFRYCQGTKQQSYTAKLVRLLPIHLPPKQEQTAIAAALSDVDALMGELDKLIAKKQGIKQATMQQLLTGKKRLAGFSGEWEVKPFKDVCWFQEGPGLRNWQFTKSGIKVINVTNLENGILNLERTDRHISLNEFHKMYEHFEIQENDIVVASSGNSYGKVAVVRNQDLPLLMNTSVIRFKPLKSLDYGYLLTFLNSNHFKNQIDLMITGGAQPNFGPAHLNKLQIEIPPTIEEQTAIATILSDMDEEINALQKKREKTAQLKQGMMQELLTGRIRLIGAIA